MKLFLKIIFFLYRLLPLWVGKFWGLFLAFLLNRVFKFRRKIIDLHLKRVYLDRGLKDRDECARIRDGFYRNFGLIFSESLRLPSGRLDYLDNIVTIEGAENLDAALAKNKGVLLLDGHIGNWELAGAAMIRKGYPIGTITKEVKGNTGNLLQHMIRDATGLITYPKKNSIKEIFKGLKRNEAIVLMIDQNMTATEGEFVDFMGYPACTLNSLAVIAERTGAAVLPASIYRNQDGLTHTCVMWPEVELERPYDDRKKNVTHNTKRFNEQLEKMIERAPDQWMWIHKRWRTRPEGEEENPFDYRALKSK